MLACPYLPTHKAASTNYSKMKWICLLVLVVETLAEHSAFEAFLGDLPMQNPDLVEGDITGIDDISERNAIVNDNMLWPDGIVPFTLDKGLELWRKSVFWASFKNYHEKTCLKFVPRTNEKDYIRMFSGEGCYSNVGRTGGAQPLSLGHGCVWPGTIIHEVGHAIGFYHEQNRSDRDDYITIVWENIRDGLADQFIKLKPHQNRLLDTFDYWSIMLYGEYTFSKDRKNLKTMVAKKEGVTLYDVVRKGQLSKSDIKRINILYKCEDKLKKA